MNAHFNATGAGRLIWPVLGIFFLGAAGGAASIEHRPAAAPAAAAAIDVGPQLGALVEADWIDRDRQFTTPPSLRKPPAAKVA